MYFLRRSGYSIVVALGKRKGGVRHYVSLEAQVAASSRGGLDRVVCADTNDGDAFNAAGMQPTFKTAVDECVWHILLDDVLAVERSQCGLKLRPGLARPEQGSWGPRNVSYMDYRRPGFAPVSKKFCYRGLCAGIVSTASSWSAHAVLHVDDEKYRLAHGIPLRSNVEVRGGRSAKRGGNQKAQLFGCPSRLPGWA